MNVVPKGAVAPQAPNPQETPKARAIAAFNAATQAPNTAPEAPAEVLLAQAAQGHANTVADPNTPESQEVTASEAPKEEAPVKEESPLSSQYAVLARKEKALRAKAQQQDAAYRAKEASLLAKEEALKARESEYKSNYIQKDKFTQDPWSTLSELGVTYDQLTQSALNQSQQDPATKAAIDSLKAELRAQQAAQDEARKGYETQQKQAYEQAVSQIRNDAKNLVNTDPEFETIKATNSINDVVELIEETFKKDKILLSVEDAAREVENYLVEEAMKIARIKKIQQRLAPKPEAPKQQAAKSPQQPQQMKTLTNSVGSSRQLSARERAILAFKGEKR